MTEDVECWRNVDSYSEVMVAKIDDILLDMDRSKENVFCNKIKWGRLRHWRRRNFNKISLFGRCHSEHVPWIGRHGILKQQRWLYFIFQKYLLAGSLCIKQGGEQQKTITTSKASSDAEFPQLLRCNEKNQECFASPIERLCTMYSKDFVDILSQKRSAQSSATISAWHSMKLFMKSLYIWEKPECESIASPSHAISIKAHVLAS